MSSFGRDRFVLPGKRSAQRVPCERCAFDANWVRRNTGKYGQLTHSRYLAVAGGRLTGHNLMKLSKEFFDLSLCLALHALCHQRSRSLRNGASRPLKSDVAYCVTIQVDIHRETLAFSFAVPIRRIPGMVESDSVACRSRSRS